MAIFLEDAMVPFTTALVLMLFFAIAEGALTLMGFGISNVLDNLLPDMPDPSLPDTDAGPLTKFLSWIRIGQVPAMVVLIIFLTTFGILGTLLQQLIVSATGSMLPAALAVIPATLGALPVTRVSAGFLGKWLMKDETQVVSTSSFVGSIATITLGKASQGQAAEARLTDAYGTTHYLMVEPDSNDIFEKGDRVLLIEKKGSTFMCIRPDSHHLI